MRTILLALLLAVQATAQAQKRLILIDQDGAGPGGTNQQSMILLLQSPQTQVLGITMVTGDAWEPENLAHTLRMLELIHRTDVPVVPGAIFPLLRTEPRTQLDQQLYGSVPWLGAFGDSANHTGTTPHHDPAVIPPLPEGSPTTHPLPEDAAHFLIRQVHAHPHQVTLFAAGPLTNIALAIRLDPTFAPETAGIVIMGGSLNPQADNPESPTDPRHEFNFWFDPEAAHITLTRPLASITVTTQDLSLQAPFTPRLLAQIAAIRTPAAQYIATYSHPGLYLWDELTAAAWLDPAMITAERPLYLDVDLTPGPTYGDTLAWTAANQPTLRPLHPVRCQTALDPSRLTQLILDLLARQPQP